MSDMTGRQKLAVGMSVVVIAAVVAGLFAAGSPSDARLRRFDDRRLEDLQLVQEAADRYLLRNGALPVTLDALVPEDVDSVRLHDPATHLRYEYEIEAARAYRLCAIFDRALEREERGYLDRWAHPAGRHCFPVTVPPKV